MGGQLGVDSKPGEGSRFWFAVGLAVISEEHPDDDAEGRRIDPIVAAPADDAAALPLRVLAVDDNELNRRLIAAMCARLPIALDCVDSGGACLERLREASFDVILMDIQMPDMDGVTTTRHIRAMDTGTATIPIIALTANAMKGDRESYLESGMDGYVSKPIKPPVLFEEIEKLCAVSITGAPLE